MSERVGICALAGALGWPGVPVRADGEDGLGCDGGADRALLAAGVAGYRAHRVGARRRRAGAAEGGRAAAAAAGQDELDLGLNRTTRRPARAGAAGRVPITSSRMGHLWDALAHAYDVLGFGPRQAGTRCSGSWCWRGSSSRPASWTAAGAGGGRGRAAVVPDAARRLPVYAKDSWRQKIAAACAARVGLGPASLVLYDVSTLYFETDEGDGFRETGFSKERRLEPQITIGLLTDASGFPLMVNAFEGNKAETTTMLPTMQAFMAAHRLADVTVVADAGMARRRTRRRSRPPGCRSSSAPGSPTSPTS